MTMKKSLFKIILAALCLLLPSCQEEEGLFSTSVYDMVLDGDCPGFDHPEIDTRAYGSTWENNDKLYIRFSNGGTTRIGEATYSSSARKWTIDAGGTLSETSSGSCRVYYLRGGSVSRSGSSVSMDEHTAIFADEYASYTYSSGVVTVSAALAPQTWRLCFKGQMGTSVTLSSNNNVKYASALNLSSGSYTTQSKKVTETVQSDGYTRFLYGTFQSNSVELEYQVNGKSYYKSVGKSRLGIGKSGYISLPMGGTLDLGLIKTFNHTINAINSTSSSDFFATVSEFNFSAVDSYLSWDEFSNHYQIDATSDGYAYQFTSTYSPVSGSAVLGQISAYVFNGSVSLCWELSAEELQKIYTYNGGSATVTLRFIPSDGANSDYKVYMSLKLNVDKQTPSYGTIGDKNVNNWYPVDYYNMTCSNVWQSGAYDAMRATVQQPVEYSNSRNYYLSLPSGWSGEAIQFKNGAMSPASYSSLYNDFSYDYFYFHPANNNIVVSDPNSNTKYYLCVESTAVSGSSAPSNVTIGSTASATIDNLRLLESNYYLTPSSGTVYQNTKIYISTRSGGKDEILCTLDKMTGRVEYSHGSLAQTYLNLFDKSSAGSFFYVGVYGLQSSNPYYVCPLVDNVFPVFLVRPLTAQGEESSATASDGNAIIDANTLVYLTDCFENLMAGNNSWMFSYYELDAISLDLPNAMADLNGSGSYAKLSTSTNRISAYHYNYGSTVYSYCSSSGNVTTPLPIYSYDSWSTPDFGNLVLDVKDASLQSFDLLVPIIFHYYWGTLPTVYAKIHVTCEQSSSPGGNGYDNGHEYVDLGLPSGLLWATCNVGANSPEDYGDYFAWGETEGYNSGKTNFWWSTYKWMQEGYSDWWYITKYTYADGQTSGIWYDSNGNFIGDNKTVLEPADDAAHINWGGSWRMPTYEELDELTTKCTWEWTTQNGVNGHKFTGPNGNSIFLPAAGGRNGSGLLGAGSFGYYWSSSLNMGISPYACLLLFVSDNMYGDIKYRFFGLSVRPVRFFSE